MKPDSQFELRHSVDGAARLGFVGDLLLARRVQETHRSMPGAVWDGMSTRLGALDTVVGNLECTLTTRGDPWPDKQWRFRGDPAWATTVLETGNVGAVSLANNHVMDYGPASVRDTTATLDAAGIAHAGAGHDRSAAFAPTTLEAGELTVAMVSYTDRFRPFTAGLDTAGTAFLSTDPRDSAVRSRIEHSLARVPESVDLVVASLHWGPNYEPKTDRHRRFGRWLIDRGVDVVHGHSAHEIAGIEVYDGRPILYDTGTFVSDFYPVENHRNDLTFLFELVVEEGLSELRLHPIRVVEESVRTAGQRGRRWLRERMQSRSAQFGTTVQERSDEGPLTVSL
ncbi:CapA family protein [Halapricum hydrolyticum]|uniref:CapA family protein n=1 Tax=Halapricum hydrolyticum TaxID=2979991 RepID=A0AAE3IDB9_9EURY|nr:CapA family protein [Halapricum hydrolyticum]MCU4717953.1 CapA family protein [Halapricum hydrolyticum]MCU4727118.1 CapA family protein [Halapricum hydrolyticum]